MEDLVSAARHGFAERFGATEDGLWSAPGRANLIGEHTDYNGGFALPFAIDRRTVVAVRSNGSDVFRVASSLYDGVVEGSFADLAAGTLPTWVTYVLGMASVLNEGRGVGVARGAGVARGGDESPGADESCGVGDPVGADIYIVSDVPLGSGLSSSAALECAVGRAFNDLWGLGLSTTQLAQAGQRAENVVVGTPTGIMDQSASLAGEADCAILLDCRSNHTEVVPLGFAAAHLTLLIVDTREEHSHAENGYAARRASCEAGAAALGVDLLRDVTLADLEAAEAALDEETYRRVRHVVTEDARVLQAVDILRAGSPAEIGPLLTASHASLRDDFEVTTARLDLVVNTALAHGALGARMTGGGFGGSAIVLVDDDAAGHVAEAIRSAYVTEGFPTPTIFPAVASAGARREA